MKTFFSNHATGVTLLLLAIFLIAIFSCVESKGQTYVYSTGVVAPGFQLQIGPVVTLRRPAVNYGYSPSPLYRPSYVPNHSHFNSGGWNSSSSFYRPSYAPVSPSYGHKPYQAPNVSIYVR